jgi:hypothetical protein
MRVIHSILIAWGLLVLTAACKKHTGQDAGKAPEVNVYVLGKVADSTIYWKNGEAHFLYKQSRINYDLGTPSIFATANDVYVIGNKPNNNTTFLGTIPLYWRNGETVILPDSTGNAYASTIYVSNNDIYAAGASWFNNDTSHVPYTTPAATYPRSGYVATLWKNGAPQTLPGFCSVGLLNNGNAVNTFADYISGLYVTGNDVYVAGGSRYFGYNAMYWKNGIRNDLTKGLIYQDRNGRHCYPTTTSIFASNNDVYVSGYQMTAGAPVTPTALFWKNGQATYLTTDSLSGSEARGIFVTNNDIHIVGYQNINRYSRAMYWKNGIPTKLTSGNESSAATAIFVSGNDVYIAGYSWTAPGNYIATWWKNGTQLKLTDGNTPAIANSIYIQ